MGQSNTLFAPVRRQSLADLVYQHIRSMILNGELPSGADVNIRDLSKRLEVSTIPVREALVRLTSDGLVTANRNHRATVVEFSDEETLAAFEYREVLETTAARLAAERIDDEHVDRLRTLNERLVETSEDEGWGQAVLDLDTEFHAEIAKAAANNHLAEQVERCHEMIRVIQWMHVGQLRDRAEPVDHSAIVTALERRDADQAEEAVRTHVESERQSLLAACEVEA